MTIPTLVRRSLLVAGPAAVVVLLGRVPGRTLARGVRPDPAWEWWAIGVPLALVALVSLLHEWDRRDGEWGDAVAAALGLSAMFLAPVVRIVGVDEGVRLVASSLAGSAASRAVLLGGIVAGLLLPPLAATAPLLESEAGRWALRVAAWPLATFVACSWALTGGQNGAARGPAHGNEALLVVGGAIALVLAFREIAWSRLLARELPEEVALAILPAAHVPILVSPWKRRLPGWWPDRSERHFYVETVLRLAFRKGQARGLGAESRRIAQLEILRLRERIRTMLAPPETPVEEQLEAAGGESRRVIEISAH